MRFIHTSDWHIGRQFHNRSLLEDQAHLLDQLVSQIDKLKPDALVIAGDLYDRSVPPADAVALVDRVFNQICQQGVPIILIPGNHDSAERLGFGASQLRHGGLHVLSRLDEVGVPVEIAGVSFYGIPFADPEQVRLFSGEPVRDYNQAHQLLVNRVLDQCLDPASAVLVSHCFVAGGEASESERPLAVGGTESVDWQGMAPFAYVALGHLHNPQYRGQEHIRYSGSLMKYSFSEAQQHKGALLVTLEPGSSAKVEPIELTPLRDMRRLRGYLDDLLAAAPADPHPDDYLMVTLEDSHAILDPIGKLRGVYPNVLHLERPNRTRDSQAQRLDRQALKRSESQLFADFFQQVSGQPLNEPQQQLLDQLIHELEAERR